MGEYGNPYEDTTVSWPARKLVYPSIEAPFLLRHLLLLAGDDGTLAELFAGRARRSGGSRGPESGRCFENHGDRLTDLRSVEAAQAEGSPAVDDVIGGHGPFFADRVVDLRLEVGRSRPYLLQAVGELILVREEPIGLPTAEAHEMIHRRSLETRIGIPGAR
jgi:hypothetical protein